MIQIWTLCGGLWFIFSKVCRCYKLFLITPSSQRNDVGEADERFVAYVFVSTSFISSVKIAHSTAAAAAAVEHYTDESSLLKCTFPENEDSQRDLRAVADAEKKRKLCSLARKI